MSWPAPWRKAASPSEIAPSTAPSAFSSGPPGLRPKPGWYMFGGSRSKRKMLVFSALKPRSFTCLPSFTRSSSERTGSTPITSALRNR